MISYDHIVLMHLQLGRWRLDWPLQGQGTAGARSGCERAREEAVEQERAMRPDLKAAAAGNNRGA